MNPPLRNRMPHVVVAEEEVAALEAPVTPSRTASAAVVLAVASLMMVAPMLMLLLKLILVQAPVNLAGLIKRATAFVELAAASPMMAPPLLVAMLAVMVMPAINLCNLGHEDLVMHSKVATVNVVPLVVSHTTRLVLVVMVAVLHLLVVRVVVAAVCAMLSKRATALETTAVSPTLLNRSMSHDNLIPYCQLL